MRTGPRLPIKPRRWRRAPRGRWFGLHPDRHWRLYDQCPLCGRRKRATAKKCHECRFRTKRVTRWRKKGDRHWVGYNPCPGGCGGLKRDVAKFCVTCRYKVGKTRICRSCKRRLPVARFRIRTRAIPKPRSYCRTCEAAQARVYLKRIMRSPKRKAEHKAKKRAWERANPQKHTAQLFRQRARQLGLGHQVDEVVHALRTRKRCAICGRAARQVSKKKGLHIDHDHRRNTFRGVLCGPCNRGLGHFEDNPKRLQRAAAYLLKHRSAPNKRNPSLAKSTKGP